MSRNNNKKHKDVSENMKKKIAGLLVILATMAAIPLVLNNRNIVINPNLIKNEEKMTKNEIITSIAASNFRKHYNKETLKALVLILNTNYKAGKINKNEIISKSEFLKKYKNGKDYYSNIENTVKNMKDEYITYRNKAVYIPYFKVSKGYTSESKKYPYLKATACPWDIIKKDYKQSKSKVGISVNSLDKICSLGANYKNAVKRFLKSD